MDKKRNTSKSKDKKPMSRRKSTSKYELRKGKKYDKIKNPRTSYTYFIMDEKVKRQAEREAGKDGDVRKMLGELWQNTTDKEREPYIKMAEEDIERYEKECEEVELKKKGTQSVKKSSKNEETGSKKKKSVNKKSKRDTEKNDDDSEDEE
jgi:hypothetical protein